MAHNDCSTLAPRQMTKQAFSGNMVCKWYFFFFLLGLTQLRQRASQRSIFVLAIWHLPIVLCPVFRA
jgi:hypothetical protein